MLISQTVQLTWNPRIKKHYVDLGYTYTKMKDKFTVKVSDLTNSSNERLTYDYRKWRNAVFKRDFYTCQKCKKKNGNGETVYLNVHHIKNWKDNPDDRYDESNGITLCQDCHNKFHSLYGKKNNTEKQLESFLKNNGKKVC